MSRLVNMTDMLNKALDEKYAVGQFNILFLVLLL